jgi:photosystem II stability/assembly factor-like uncharacterized protein
MVNGIGTSEKWTDLVLAGLQDNGTIVRDGNTTRWDKVIGGDGWGVDVGEDERFVLGSVNGQHLFSDDGGFSFQRSEDGLPVFAPGTFRDPFDVRYAEILGDESKQTFLTISGDPHPNTPTGTSSGVYRTDNAGRSWNDATGEVKLADGKTVDRIPGNILEVSTSAKLPNLWAAATAEGRVYTTSDSGKTWSESSPIPDVARISINSMDFDSNDPTGQTMYVATANFEAPGTRQSYLWKTTDGGKTWTGMHGEGDTRLPAVPANVVRVSPQDPNVVFVGNTLGVYQSLDGGLTWNRYGDKLPFVSVTDMDVSPDGQHLRIGTYGRGVFEI